MNKSLPLSATCFWEAGRRAEKQNGLFVRCLIFDKSFEAEEAFIPFGFEGFDPLFKFGERRGHECIAFFASLLMDSDQSGFFEDMKMLENALPRDGVIFGKLSGCFGT